MKPYFINIIIYTIVCLVNEHTKSKATWRRRIRRGIEALLSGPRWAISEEHEKLVF